MAAIAFERRNRGDADDPTPACPDHWQHEWLRYVEKTVHRDVDNSMPLLSGHPGKRRVIVNAGVVDENLDRAISEHPFESCAGGGGVRDIKGEHLCLSAFSDDFGHQGAGGVYAAMRLCIHKMAVSGQATADCGADLTTAAGDECAARG